MPPVLRTMELRQRSTFEEHFAAAVALTSPLVDDVKRLAVQMDSLPVVPVLGAGASFDCGMRLAAPISKDLAAIYASDPRFFPREHIADPGDLGNVAQAIANSAGQPAAVRAIRLPENDAWPSAEHISEHFCLYRVLARMAREGFVGPTIGFNYDCGFEAGLEAEGFSRSPYTAQGQQWHDHADVVADAATHSALRKRPSLTVFKAHGCAHRYREMAVDDEAKAAETVVLLASQLNNWRKDTWIRDEFRSLARQNILLAIGFAGQDAVIAGEISAILSDVYSAVPRDGVPRVVAVNHQPMTPPLGALINAGLGGVQPAKDMVTRLDTSATTTTAFALALLTELLHRALDKHVALPGPELSNDPAERLAALIILVPIMLRWTFLLRSGSPKGFVQNVNLRQAAQRGYVPLLADIETTARAIRSRSALRSHLGLPPESDATAVSDSLGFLVSRGVAYMPVGLEADELQATCRPGNTDLDTVRGLPSPTLDRVLVAITHDHQLVGMNLDTGVRVQL